MAPTLELTFSTGENEIQRIQWELLDTPPARIWRELFEDSYRDHSDYDLDDTEATFCRSDVEAQEYLELLRFKLKQLGIQRDATIYDYNELTDLLGDLFQLFRREQDSWDRNVLISDCINLLKPVLWYSHSRGTGLGHIYHHPEKIYTHPFVDSWYEYATMDTVEGDLYAEIIYETAPWHQFAMCMDAPQVAEFIGDPNVGQANFITSAFSAHWNEDMRALKMDLQRMLQYYNSAICSLHPKHDYDTAMARAGRIPVAKLRDPVDYEILKKLKKIRKVEIL